MPKWGLTDEQRRSLPWGLDPAWLAPAKTITDPVHHDVYLTVLEKSIVDSPAMQRLRRVRQLGTTSLVYPAATQSRFSHALGTLRAAQDLMDAVVDNRSGPRHQRDLLDEWHDEGSIGDSRVFDLKVAEATVLARLGGLMHDLCHVPLGHTIEDDLKVLTAHDGNEPRFERLWPQLGDVAQIIDRAESRVPGRTASLKEELRMLILSKEGKEPADLSLYPFVGDIVGNTICADLIDYLQRDHQFTGLPIALGRRFMNDFYVMESSHVHYAGRMVVRINKHGHKRSDIVTELVKYLRYRYELTERVLTHHAKLAADAMIGKLLEMWSDIEWVAVAAGLYPKETAQVGHEDLERLRQAIAAGPDGEGGPARVKKEVEDRLEHEFTRRSDDGLLEHLQQLGDGAQDKRKKAVSEMAGAVLDRQLFKLIGRASGEADRALAEEKYAKFGTPDVRRRLETAAARRAGLEHGWKVVIWLPSPNMRLKVADVLVDSGDAVAPLARVEPAGEEIVDQHRKLWSISVYAHTSVRDELPAKTAQVLLSSLKTDMDIGLVRWDGETVKTLPELAVDIIADRAHLSPESRRGLAVLAPAARGDETFAGYVKQLWRNAAAQADGVVEGEPPPDLW